MGDFGLVFDDRFQQHLTGPGHPERPARLDAIRAGLESAGLLASATRIEVQPLALDVIHRLHTTDYTARAARACADGLPYVDTPDSAVCRESWQIARLAAGGVVAAARAIGTGRMRRAFCAVRPPGHHAEADRSMGFCLLANVALAARVLRDDCDIERVMIVDWDVHHGNGTQHLFEADPSVFFISLHTHPQHEYPGTGFAEETGVGTGRGFTLNVPFLPGCGDREYEAAFAERIVPAAERFNPQVLLISAGFDAHAADPIGTQRVSDDGFDAMTRAAIGIAERHCDGRILSVLEGGYSLEVLRRCVAQHCLRLVSD